MLTADADTEDPSVRELIERVSLMEGLIEQGREATRRWGEFAVLWGTGSITAAIAAYRGAPRAWIWLQVICIPLALLLFWRRKHKYAVASQSDRFVDILWFVTGITMSIVSLTMGANPRLGTRGIEVIMYLLLGVANAINGLTLRWPLQIMVAVLWFGAGLLSLHVNQNASVWLHCGTVLVGEVVFGIYLDGHREKGFLCMKYRN